MRLPVGIAAALVALSAAVLLAPLASAGAAAVSPHRIVVTTTSDVVNGNVTSLAALKAKPGRDGISLREALKAANHTRGTAALVIMFSHALNGKTIKLRSELPPIHRNHLVLEGVSPNGSPARVTLDGRHAPSSTTNELLLVQASEVTVRWLRFSGLHAIGNGAGREAALRVWPGAYGSFLGPQAIAKVAITDNVFDNRGASTGTGQALLDGLLVGTGFGGHEGVDTQVSGITVARNTFLAYTNDDALGVWANASGAAMSAVVIKDNSFAANGCSIEMSEGGRVPRQSGVQIIGNTILSGGTISLNTTNATRGTIDGTLIEDNWIAGSGGAITMSAETFNPDMGGTAGGDVISDTQIVNNVMRAGLGNDVGIWIMGGDRTAPSASRVSDVTIENDTLINDGSGDLLAIIPNGVGASGNAITGVIVRNSILYDPAGTPINQGAPVPEQPPDVVMNSLISGPGWAGVNGDIGGDPGFVDEAGGNYHLAAGGPCIDTGTTLGAPASDFDGAKRDSTPDIGAFEYGAIAHSMLMLSIK